MKQLKPILPVGIAGVGGVLRVRVVPGGAPLLLSKEFLKDFGCHIDLGRGHLFFEKLGVRAVVTSKQSPHLLLPLTSIDPRGHKIPTEIQPRISSDECAIYRATCDSSRQDNIHRVSPQYRHEGQSGLTASTLNPIEARMNKSQTLVTKRETTGKTERDDG